ncbi:MAG: hypothetical protein EZS28_040088, partial [Streblomastix strix]
DIGKKLKAGVFLFIVINI